MKIGISPELLATSQGKLCLGVIVTQVKVRPIQDELWRSMQTLGNLQKERYEGIKPDTIPQIQALVQTYKALGLKTADYKGSNEALLKRVCSDKGLYQINTVVDANNYGSLASLRSIGSYDLSKLSGDIQFRPGLPEETYTGTTQRPLKLHHLPVLCDAAGPFGSPTSDSKRALITLETVNLMSVIFSFDGETGLEENLQQMADLLSRYSDADRNTMQIKIVKGEMAQLFNLPVKVSPAATNVEQTLSHFSSVFVLPGVEGHVAQTPTEAPKPQ